MKIALRQRQVFAHVSPWPIISFRQRMHWQCSVGGSAGSLRSPLLFRVESRALRVVLASAFSVVVEEAIRLEVCAAAGAAEPQAGYGYARGQHQIGRVGRQGGDVWPEKWLRFSTVLPVFGASEPKDHFHPNYRCCGL